MKLVQIIKNKSDYLFRFLFRFLFKYDIFISYAHDDAQTYALNLRDQLRSLDFTCFLDLDELSAGEHLRQSLKQSIRRSATFVLVGTRKALASTYVVDEIKEFNESNRIAIPKRKIIPINVDGTLDDPPSSIATAREVIWIVEQGKAVEDGLPSSHVANDIDQAYRFTRRKVRRRIEWISASLVTSMIVLISVYVFWQQASAARELKQNLDIQIAQLTSQKTELETRTQQLSDERTKLERETAQLRKDQGELKTLNTQLSADKKELGVQVGQAKIQLQHANVLTAKARTLQGEAEAEARKQEEIGVATRLANQSQWSFRHQPEFFQRSALLATESMNRFAALGMHSLDADLALRDSLTLLRSLKGSFTSKLERTRFPTLSSEGRYVAIAGDAAGKPVVEVWDTALGSNIVINIEHEDISSVVTNLSADGLVTATSTYFTLGDKMCVTEIWESRTGRLLLSLKGRNTCEGNFLLSPDGKHLALKEENAVSVIEISSGKTVFEQTAPEETTTTNTLWAGKRMAFSSGPTYQYFTISGKDELQIWEWRKPTNKPLAVLKIDGYVTRVAFDSTETYLATVVSKDFQRECSVQVWQWKRNVERPVLGPLNYATAFAEVLFSPEGKYLATMGSLSVTATDQILSLWKVPSGDEVFQQRPVVLDIQGNISFSPDGNFLVTKGFNDSTRVWDIRNNREVARIANLRVALDAAFSSDGQSLITTSSENQVAHIYVWDLASSLPVARMENSEGTIASLEVSSDGRYFVAATYEGLAVYGIPGGRMVNDLKNPRLSAVYDVALSPDGTYLVAVGKYDEVPSVLVWKDWNAAKPQLCSTFSGHDIPTKLSISKDGRFLATVGMYERTSVWAEWETEHPRLLAEIAVRVGSSVDFSSSGTYLATGNRNGRVAIWDWQKSTELPVFKIEESTNVRAVAFSFDDKYLVSTNEREAHVWDWKQPHNKPVASVPHEGVRKAAFVPGEHLLLTAGGGMVRFWDRWDTSNPLEVSRIFHAGSVTAVDFSGDGKFIGTANSLFDGSEAQIWPWRPDDLISAACDRLRRAISTNEPTDEPNRALLCEACRGRFGKDMCAK